MTESELLVTPPHTGETMGEGRTALDELAAAPAMPSEASDESGSLGNVVWELLQTLILAGLLIVFFRTFIFQNYIVEGNSMLPTLTPEQRLIVGRINYILGDPQRGDVIVFQYPGDPSRDFVKRIIGLPDETISTQNGQVFIDGEALPREDYVHYPQLSDLPPTQLGSDEYFVMGDNRAGSSDSRSWGPLGERHIIGKAWMVYYPFSEFGLVPHADLEPGT